MTHTPVPHQPCQDCGHTGPLHPSKRDPDRLVCTDTHACFNRWYDQRAAQRTGGAA